MIKSGRVKVLSFWSVETTAGAICIVERGGSIVTLHFGDCPLISGATPFRSAVLDEAFQQLHSYFDGQLFRFNLPLEPEGTPFMKDVWSALARIPYGTTVSYKELAIKAGCHGAARAVGMACRMNPLPIFIPCHRVTRKDGNIGGYLGGIQLKRYLLDFEHRSYAQMKV